MHDPYMTFSNVFVIFTLRGEHLRENQKNLAETLNKLDFGELVELAFYNCVNL